MLHARVVFLDSSNEDLQGFVAPEIETSRAGQMCDLDNRMSRYGQHFVQKDLRFSWAIGTLMRDGWTHVDDDSHVSRICRSHNFLQPDELRRIIQISIRVSKVHLDTGSQ